MNRANIYWKYFDARLWLTEHSAEAKILARTAKSVQPLMEAMAGDDLAKRIKGLLRGD